MAQENVKPLSQSVDQQLRQRDGTSQAARLQAALDPGYVAIDARSTKDLLAFAREYAKELNYFDLENGQVQAMSDWSLFLSSELDLDEVVAFMQEPEKFSPEKAHLYTRPHFVLFLTFLQLLRHTQDQLNLLTRRHLDFYYQRVLRMAKRPGNPDQVNVLIDLAPDIEQFLLAAGTLLNAGADSLGQNLLYRTDRDLVANRAQVVKLSSIYIEKRIIGIRQAREEHDGPKAEAFMLMLQVALGQPLPGDPLPRYETGQKITYDFLLSAQQLVDFVRTGLFMDFAEFRTLMQLKHRRDQSDPEWQEINQILEKVGRKRSTGFKLSPANPRDFEANLYLAVGEPPNFDGLTEVENIYDLYDQRIRESVQQFIQTKLYFDDINDFFRIMQIKVRIDNEWGEIHRLLEAAGQRKGNLKPNLESPYTFPVKDPKEPAAFEANLAAAVGPLVYPSLPQAKAITDLDSYYAHFLAVEQYFFMPAESFSYVMSVAEKEEAPIQEWDKVYSILAEAHKAKVYADRKKLLKQIRETQGFEAMIAFALGDASLPAGQTALERLKEFIKRGEDADFLEQISRKAAAGKVTDLEWDATYRIVELAQRVRLGEPIAQKEEWLNLYPAEDATTVQVDAGTETGANAPRWKTFGQAQPAVPQDSPPPTTFGWAISSPILALSQGRRTITLTLGFGVDQFHEEIIRRLFPELSDSIEPGNEPFCIEISTEKGWLQADVVKVTMGDYSNLSNQAGKRQDTLPALQFELTLAENVPALTSLPVEADGLDTPWPVLRLMLRQIWQPERSPGEMGRYINHYQPFKELVLLRTHLKVAVSGLTPWQMQNDETTLPVNKPFEPFGTRPGVGSRFYLGHPELIYKKLDRLQLQLEWMGAPDDLATYYKNYDLSITPTKNFTARISLIDQRLALPLLPDAPLFASPKANAPHTIALDPFPAAIEAGRPGYKYERAIDVAINEDLLAWNRYLQWELNAPDFQHETYPTVVTKKSIELAAAISNKAETVKAENYQANPPYTPKIKQLSLDYTSSIEISLQAYKPGSQIDKLFHIHPFGYHEILPQVDTPRYLFLPQYEAEGELYLGIREAHPPQNLSLLFQMAEGSADPDVDPVPMQWSYLSGNRWFSLDEGNVLLDTSRGLINSGIISLALPPAQPSTLLTPNLYWLRVAIPQHSQSVCDTIAIHTQALSATFADHDNAPDHLSQPLPAGSITELAEPLSEVSGIRQPYTSYRGKMPEQDQTFYTRISERLRHKHRMLTIWDYEHMLLERFPQVYKVKCLPAEAPHLGQVEIIVIPDIRNKRPFDPFEPKAPSDLLADIAAYLAENSPAFAAIKVKNAHYVPVKVRFAVRFRPGYNEGYYKQRLNDELNRFLSPWAYEEGAEIVIGGRIYANVIINFIEEQPYVDYVAQVKLFTSEDGRTFKLALSSASEGYWVETDRPDGILVAARQHEIDMIPDTGYEDESFVGINYMKIELDFVVG